MPSTNSRSSNGASYADAFSKSTLVESELDECRLDNYSALFREPDFLLREELKEIERYCGILFALASGAPGARQITDKTGISERNLHYYFQNLIELGYVSRRHPLTEQTPSPRQGQFRIEDPLLRFWFRFVYPHQAFLGQNGPDRMFAEHIAPHIGLRTDNRVDLGECKWGAIRSTVSLEEELSVRMRRYPNPSNATLQGRIFCRRAPKRFSRPPTHRWHTLEELYALPARCGE